MTVFHILIICHYSSSGVYWLIDDQDIVDSVTTSNANGTWKQGRHILRQSVLHTSMIGI